MHTSITMSAAIVLLCNLVSFVRTSCVSSFICPSIFSRYAFTPSHPASSIAASTSIVQ